MDVCLVIQERLARLGLEQKDLAAAAQVTESYISQLLTRKKLPPASERTDIYDKIGRALKLPPLRNPRRKPPPRRPRPPRPVKKRPNLCAACFDGIRLACFLSAETLG